MYNYRDRAKNYHKEFSERMTHLRRNKGVSARDMSLSLGLNPGYIAAIENRKALPKMGSFFDICDYLEVSPKEFFDTEIKAPTEHRLLYERLKKLDRIQLEHISAVVDDMTLNNTH